MAAMEEEFSSNLSKLAIETQPVEQYPSSKKQQRGKQVSSLSEKTKREISQASNDVLFQYIEQHQQGTFGQLLDAADETMQLKVLEEARMVQIEHHGNIQVGNWITDAELCCGKVYDCILADYLIGAMDGFSPYCQDMIFSRLSKHLHPEHGRLYVVGLNPIPDHVDGEANILCEITRLRDACILLAGHRCYREYPLEWIERALVQSGYQVIDSAKFPILYSQASVVRQLNVARSKLAYFKSPSLAKAMSQHIDEVEERVRNILLQKDGQRIKLGFDYVVIAELLK